MALQRGVYRPRDAEHAVLHQVIAEHLEAFLRAVAEAGDGAGLPQFVEREFREFVLPILCLRFNRRLATQPAPRDAACKTRGQDGFAILLSCRALSSPTTCRFIPAHPI